MNEEEAKDLFDVMYNKSVFTEKIFDVASRASGALVILNSVSESINIIKKEISDAETLPDKEEYINNLTLAENSVIEVRDDIVGIMEQLDNALEVKKVIEA